MSEETDVDTMSRSQSVSASAMPSRYQSMTDMTEFTEPSGGDLGDSKNEGGKSSETRVHFDESGQSGHSDADGFDDGIQPRPRPSPQSLVLPFGMELIDQVIVDHGDGNSETLTLPKDVFAVTLPVRFELPLGAKLAPGVILGCGVQFYPGTILSRSLEVLEWPPGLPLPAGHELVRLLPEHHCLPMGTCVRYASP